jgi:hypothetical protein
VALLRRHAGALVLALVTGGCAAHPPPSPRELAEFTTRAVYDADVPRTATYFDAHLRSTVTPQSVAAVSKMMHRYGAYQGVAQAIEISKDTRYDFEAQFSEGSMLVQMKLGETGKTITAFRFVPNERR